MKNVEKKKVVSEKTASAKVPEVETEKPAEKVSALGAAMVRISPDEAQYVKMHNEEGWFQGVGAPRLPELDKTIRLTLSLAVKTGHALFANAGGIRVLKNANGKGGACFIEKKNMSSGTELFLLGPNMEKATLEKAGLVVTREASKGSGFYVKPRMKDGELAFETIAAKFGNNHAPMNFVVHDWPGYVVSKEEKKVKKVKAEKVPEKKEGKVLTKTEKPAEKVAEKAPKHKEKSGKKTQEEPRQAVA